jgi:hypothetical protein
MALICRFIKYRQQTPPPFLPRSKSYWKNVARYPASLAITLLGPFVNQAQIAEGPEPEMMCERALLFLRQWEKMRHKSKQQKVQH